LSKILFHKLVLFSIVLLLFLGTVFLISNSNDAENSTYYYKAYIYSLTAIAGIIIFSGIYWVASQSHHEGGSAATLKANQASETNDLIKAFYALAIKVEDRNSQLRDNLESLTQENHSKSNFLMSISHELRTPMHAILNLAERGKTKADDIDREKLKHYFTRIEESGERLLRLINSLLDFTRLESKNVNFQFKRNDIIHCANAVIEELKPISEEKRVTLQTQYNQLQTTAFFDYDRIFQVMCNVASNALKFSSPESSIQIIVSETDSHTLDSGQKDCLEIKVIDDGVGISKDEAELIFDKFTQGKQVSPGVGGSGLGLAICREIIEFHKGKIWAEAKNPRGTIITIHIPLDLETHSGQKKS
jgi:two-component system sensor kinase FixL